MLAIISDIHANLEALQAVLADIDRRGVSEVICLGDVVGYGPDPKACLDLVRRRCSVAIMGNHDHAVFYEPANFNIGAERASFWTRQSLEDEPDIELRNVRWEFLGRMAIRHERGQLLMVHGSPRRPVNEYIFPDDVYTNPAKLSAIFERVEHLCFVGHTHVPGVFRPDPDFYSPDELEYRYPITSERAIINVGSVGQSRDRDPRASYVLVDDEAVQFVRVPYDVEVTIAKIYAIEAIDNFEAERLREGR